MKRGEHKNERKHSQPLCQSNERHSPKKIRRTQQRKKAQSTVVSKQCKNPSLKNIERQILQCNDLFLWTTAPSAHHASSFLLTNCSAFFTVIKQKNSSF